MTDELDDFMCHCQPEGKARCEEMYEWALKDLKCEPADFVNALVYGLQWNLEKRVGRINDMACDQWCGVSAHIQDWDEVTGKYGIVVNAHVQCDKVEHGLARIWKWAKEE